MTTSSAVRPKLFWGKPIEGNGEETLTPFAEAPPRWESNQAWMYPVPVLCKFCWVLATPRLRTQYMVHEFFRSQAFQ
jgi:hypothetical protein